jgi:hypothetical protein
LKRTATSHQTPAGRLLGRALCDLGARNGRQAASNAEALSVSLVDAEIKALDQATTAWRR